MGKAEAGSTKAIANAIKAKGLGRLRWYCQVCEKQCRDENGFQAHCRSEPHMRKILAVGPKAGSMISDFSRQFQYDYLLLLRTRHSTNRVRANAVYNEYIQDRDHVHMNATRWVTLSGFVMHLGKEGIVRVDEDDKGLWVQWIDNRPETLAKQERATMDGEERERKMLEDQIARARAQMGDASEQAQGLQKPEGQKFSLNLMAPPAASNSSASAPGSSGDAAPASHGAPTAAGGAAPAEPNSSTAPDAAAPAVSVGFNVRPAPVSIANPLKRPASGNVFKSAKAAKTDDKDASNKPKAFMSEAERLMREDQARKGRAPAGYAGAGPRRGG